MNTLKLVAEKRAVFGRKVKKLRAGGMLPANIYGKKVKSEAVQISLSEFQKVFKEAGETGLVELEIGKEKRPVLIHNVQVNPVSDAPIHTDFLQVDLKEKVKAAVPVELSGESPAEKQGLGTLVQYIDEIEVEAYPADLPDKFEIDVTSLIEVDNAVLIKDIKVDSEKVLIKNDTEQIVAKVEPLRKEEEVVPVAEEVVEAAVPTEGVEQEAKEAVAPEEKPQPEKKPREESA